MSTNRPHLASIASALRAFGGKPFPEAALGLLSALGYRSNRQLEFPSIRQFLEQFDSNGRYAKHFNDAKSPVGRTPVRMFQLTGDEIKACSDGQLQLQLGKEADLRLFDSFLFVAIALPNPSYTRTELAERSRTLNSLFRQPVIVLFGYDDFVSLAITYRRTNRRDRSRDVLDRKVTLVKDIRCSKPHRAHQEILADFSLPCLTTPPTRIGTFAELDDAWRSALSTQELNKRFYSELAAWYYWATNSIRLPIIADYLQGREKSDEENVKQFTIRMLCRTIFCWFLKERGLIDARLMELTDSADREVVLVRRPANSAAFTAANSYYRGILQNVFFNCLNTPMDQRRHDAARAANDKTVANPAIKKLAYRGKQHLPEDFDFGLFDRIPYLNGGLFDVLPEDNASDTIDDGAICVPNALFYAAEHKFTHGKKVLAVKGLNRILDGYKFTIAENTPLEEEVALDPELLGLVFENLLAEVDTSDKAAAASARKASGSYYTPRRVIDYMVNEALRVHLESYIRARSATPDECRGLLELIHHDEFDPGQKRLAGWIVEAFDEIRILDPACGSGAFPMGALHRMVAILQKVDPQNRRWLHRQVGHIPDRHLRETAERELARHADDYSRKLGLIKNAVYGVDIQPLAVLITKLRFFISLLVDQNLDLGNPQGNYGLTPLPNLETKVLCANTLRDVQVSLFDLKAIPKYQAARDEYYQPETCADRRMELADEIAAALGELLPGFSKEVTGHEPKDHATQQLRNRELLKEWFRHSTLPAPFFNFAVFFPEVCADEPAATVGGELPLVNDAQTQQELVVPRRKAPASQHSGFDIVIGNPPYGGTDIPDEVKTFLNLGSKDPYGAFIARFMRDGLQSTPLRRGGVLAYIVSDTFMTIKSHRPLREQLMGSRVHKMIRVHPDTFSATVNTAIILLQKGGGPGSKPPTDAELLQAWQTGPWCQMVDLTQVSIHEQHDRFLTLLFDTLGAERRRDVATESCAVYHYPQTFIARNSNLPFFVASPKLFELVNDTTASVTHDEIAGHSIVVRTVAMNGTHVRLVKLGDATEVLGGVKTYDNTKFVRSADGEGRYECVRDALIVRRELTQKEKDAGIRITSSATQRYVEFDKSGEMISDDGRVLNYLKPPEFYIDWSEDAVAFFASRSGLRNKHRYFRPGITYSVTGVYAPTFRVGVGKVFGQKGATIFTDTLSEHFLLGQLCSLTCRFLIKNFLSHGVDATDSVIEQIPVLVDPIDRLSLLVERLVNRLRSNPSHDYASNEQLEIDRLVYDAYGLNRADIAEVETWYARRYKKLADAQRRNLRAAGKVPNFDRWCVYCDETGHIACDSVPQMILGALLVPRERVRPMTLALRARLKAIGWPAKRELKWTKVSPAGLKFYETALDFFLSEPDLRFRAIVAPKSPPPPKLPAPPPGADDPGSPAWEAYHRLLEETAPAAVDFLYRHEAWYYDRYFDLLRETLVPPAHHAIYVDVKDTRGGARIRALEDRLADAHYDWTRSGIVEGVSQIASHDVLLDQLADLLLGCLAWIHGTPCRNAGHQASPAKAALAAKVKAVMGQPDPTLVPKIVVDHSPERSPSA